MTNEQKIIKAKLGLLSWLRRWQYERRLQGNGLLPRQFLPLRG